jgi:hypothetical protein
MRSSFSSQVGPAGLPRRTARSAAQAFGAFEDSVGGIHRASRHSPARLMVTDGGGRERLIDDELGDLAGPDGVLDALVTLQ